MLLSITPIICTLYLLITNSKPDTNIRNVYGKITNVRKILKNKNVDHYQLSFRHNTPNTIDVEELLFYPDNTKIIKFNNFEEIISDNYCVHLTINYTKIVNDINLIQKNCE